MAMARRGGRYATAAQPAEQMSSSMAASCMCLRWQQHVLQPAPTSCMGQRSLARCVGQRHQHARPVLPAGAAQRLAGGSRLDALQVGNCPLLSSVIRVHADIHLDHLQAWAQGCVRLQHERYQLGEGAAAAQHQRAQAAACMAIACTQANAAV